MNPNKETDTMQFAHSMMKSVSHSAALRNVALLFAAILYLQPVSSLAGDQNPNTDWFCQAEYGVFMHFLPGDANGLALVKDFDVVALADQLDVMGAKYFVITLGQNSGFMNSPNTAYEKYTGYAPGERCSTRDLPMALYRALQPKGIRLMLYLPCQVPNEDARAQKAFGLPQGAKDQPIDMAFAEKWSEVIQEWSDRYGDKVSGWWFDGGYGHIGFNDAIAERYATAVMHGNPTAIVTFNPGVKVIRWTKAEDYTAGELNEPLAVIPAGRWLDGSQWHALTYLGDNWGRRNTRFTDAQWVEWAQKVTARQGVFTLDMGPNYDAAKGPVGSLSQAQVNQVKAIGAVLRPDANNDIHDQSIKDAAGPRLPRKNGQSGLELKGLPLREKVSTKMEPPAHGTPGLLLHVAQSGNDSGDGSVEKPFASLEQARDGIRAIRKKAGMPKGGVTVLVHGGEYAVSKTFALTAEDSGIDGVPVRYCAAPGEKAVFHGGIRLGGWNPLNDPNLYPLLPRESIGKVWYVDLKSVGITDPMPLSGESPAHELFFNDQAMQLARGPNEGFLHIAGVAVTNLDHGPGAYDTRPSSTEGVFTYNSDLPDKWAAEPNLLLYGYWFWGWSEAYQRVEHIDTIKRLISLAKPWHENGFSVDAPFFAYNALSELDAPGEWYLDRVNGRVLIYPPSDIGKSAVHLSTFASPMVTLEHVSNVRFEGLTWEFGSGDAIHINGGSNCLFAGCTIRHFAGNAVEVKGGSKHSVLSCDIYSMGGRGIWLEGGDRKTLVPGGHFAENCDIHHLSRISHTYTPAVWMEGVGNQARHNRLHDIASSAIRLGGNDHIVEYNEIYNVVTESDDQGGIDMWNDATYRGNVFRNNYWHHIGNWKGTGELPRCGQCAIRLDDGICGTLIQGNIFERCAAGKIIGFGAVQINGGKDNVIENNLFVDCMAMISESAWDEDRWREYAKSTLDRMFSRDLYFEKYQAMNNLTEEANLNHVRNNRSIRCAEQYRAHYGAVLNNLKTTNNINLPVETEFNPKTDNPLFTQPGFERIPIEEMGVYTDSWRK